MFKSCRKILVLVAGLMTALASAEPQVPLRDVIFQKADFVIELMKAQRYGSKNQTLMNPKRFCSKISDFVKKLSCTGLSLGFGAGAAFAEYVTFEQYKSEKSDEAWIVGTEISNVLAMLAGCFYFSAFKNYSNNRFLSLVYLYMSAILPFFIKVPEKFSELESFKPVASFSIPFLSLPLAFLGGRFFCLAAHRMR